SIGVAVYRSDLAHTAPAGLPSAAMVVSRNTLGGALSVAEHLPPQLGGQLVSAARGAFTPGLDAAALGAAIAMVVAAVLSARFFRGIGIAPEDAQPAALNAQADNASNQPELAR